MRRRELRGLRAGEAGRKAASVQRVASMSSTVQRATSAAGRRLAVWAVRRQVLRQTVERAVESEAMRSAGEATNVAGLSRGSADRAYYSMS